MTYAEIINLIDEIVPDANYNAGQMNFLLTKILQYAQGGSGGGGGSLTLRTNGTPNVSQALLDLRDGNDIELVDNGDGTVTINYTGEGGGGFFETGFKIVEASDIIIIGTVGYVDSISYKWIKMGNMYLITGTVVAFSLGDNEIGTISFPRLIPVTPETNGEENIFVIYDLNRAFPVEQANSISQYRLSFRNISEGLFTGKFIITTNV